MPASADIDGLSLAALKGLVLQLLSRVAEQERLIAELRDENARLKGSALPPGVVGHFGPELRRFVLAQHHQGQVTVPRLAAHRQTQFAVGQHALCWVHAERLVHKLDAFTDLHRAARERMRALIWWFYDDLKAYRTEPTARRRGELRARFDRIFRRRTGFVTLDRLLQRLHANKPELLMVLDRPDIPLHTNGSERAIRLHVTSARSVAEPAVSMAATVATHSSD